MAAETHAWRWASVKVRHALLTLAKMLRVVIWAVVRGLVGMARARLIWP